MKHPTKKEERRIQDFLTQMEGAFGVQNYDRSVHFAKEDHENNAAKVDIYEDYQRFKITIYPCFWENSLEHQREFLLHEFCHYLVEPLSQLSWDMIQGNLQTKEHRRVAVEKSTSLITNIVAKLLTDNMQFAKSAYKKYLK